MDLHQAIDLHQAVAKATADWLAEKASNGLGGVFSESVLTLPVAEFLIKEKGCAAKAEQDGQPFEGAVRGNQEYVYSSGNVNYDLVSWPDPAQSLRDTAHMTIWEMKYLKRINDSRIVKDFAKLALPRRARVERLFLVANGIVSSTSPLLMQIGSKASCVIYKGKDIVEGDGIKNAEVHFKVNEAIISLDEDTRKAIRKYLSPDYRLMFDVERIAKARSSTRDETSYDVAIYSLTPMD
jgi:hypothetical protein